MKKILIICLALVPMLFASQRTLERADADVTPTVRTPAERLIGASPMPDQANKVQQARATSRQEDTLYYDGMSNVNSIGMNTTGYHWSAAVRFTTTELAPYAGYNLIAVVVYRAAYTTANDSIQVYGQGTPILPGPIVSEQTWTPTTGAWNRIDLLTPVAINGTDDIWIADAHTEMPGGFPSGVGPGPYVAGKGDWVNDSGAWYELGPLGLNYNWNIWAIVAPAGGSTGGPDDFGYTWIDSEAPGGPTFNWVEINATGTATNATDDDEIWPIPFPGFPYYGMTFDTIGISSNGAIYFEDLTYWPLSNYALPYGTYTNQFIALYWDDLNAGTSGYGEVYWEVIGDQLVIEWDSVPNYGTSDYVKAELILNRNTGDILMQYLMASGEAGSGATVGIQGDTTVSPAWYLEFLYNSADLQDNYAILFEAPSMGPVVWDFETGLQAWTHTNGMPFPAGWDVEAAALHGSLPDAGDSTMWVDSDAGGSTFWIQDSALSPVCTPNSGMDWLKYGFFNYGGSGSYINELHVGIKHSTGGVWTATELALYPSGVLSGPAWDSVDVSAYASADFVQVYFYFDDLNTWGYYAAFDNVSIDATPYAADHDVGCTEVVSPPEGSCVAGDYDVIGRIQNFGNNAETFDAMAVVYDTVGMTQVFSQSVTLTGFPVAGDSNVNFGTVTFNADSYYYTMIYTMLSGDSDPSNDTSAVYSTTAIGLGDVIYELDAQAVVTDNQLLGIEFDGERFYITGGGNGADPNKVYVVDTAGTLLWALDQPSHSTGWGWRDLAWDDVYVGPDRIDTLYASVNTNVDYFSIDLTGGVLTYHGFSPGAQNPNRALAYKPDSGWFYTANFSSSCYKFDKSGVIVQSVPNTLAHYGAAYDGDTTGGPYVWWHSQDDPGTGFLCQITQMDAQTMTFGPYFGFALPAALTDAMAGGLCFYSGFNDMDVLFALLQGTPNDYIVGIYVRPTPGTGVEGKPGATQPLAFGFAPTLTTVSRGRMPIAYSTTVPGRVSLKVYDNMGRLVQTLVNAQQPAGEKSVYWDNKDVNQRTVSNGVYFLKLEAAGETAVHKLILVR